jgi:hydrogenase maturation protease
MYLMLSTYVEYSLGQVIKMQERLLEGDRHCPEMDIKTIVLGMGNPLRCDDGIGVAVVLTLKKSYPLSENITIMDAGTSGLEALLLMQGYQRAFIIDAADIGGAPGDWRCIPIEELSFIPEGLAKSGSAHQAGLKEVIALGQVLGTLPEEIFIYAVQPQDLQISIGLSDTNAAALHEIVEDLIHRLGSGLNHPGRLNDKNVEA